MIRLPRPKVKKRKLTLGTVTKLAERWQAGESMSRLAKKARVSWQALAGYFIAAGYRATDRRKRTGPDWFAAAAKAEKTAKQSITMFRVLVAKLKTKTRWESATFTGPHGHEQAGVVDILLVRKDHRPGRNGLKRGDLLDILLIQVKGGSARSPSKEDIQRLRRVRKHYRARAVLPAQWKKGQLPVLFRLKRTGDEPATAWKWLDDPLEMFR